MSLDLENSTRRQHFVSQAEQRMNAMNPNAQPENQRIVEFDVVDRNASILRARDPSGRTIAGSLSWDDLFSFDVATRARSNLEALFQRYESDITRISHSLLQKLGQSPPSNDIKAELLDLFAPKFLNFLRNPYSVSKVLNTIGALADRPPDDATFEREYELVRTGSKPQRDTVCRCFGLAPDAYDRWLIALFRLLVPVLPPRLSVFEDVLKHMFESHMVIVQVHQYTDTDPTNVCLLSDRGFNTPTPEDVTWADAFDFNISSRAFATFAFCDPVEHPAGQARPELAADLRAQVHVRAHMDDIDALVRYNQTTAFQCARTVFAATLGPRMHP